MPRTVAPLLFLLIPIVTATQTASDFTARYGDPDAERFVVRPRITLMASYADDRTACEMLIETEHPIQQSGKEQSMSTATVSRIIEELVPESERGVLLFRMNESMGASELQVADYQNVTIRQYFLRYLPTNHDEKSATIIRKDGRCSSATASQKFGAGIGLNAIDLHARYGEPNIQRFAARPASP